MKKKKKNPGPTGGLHRKDSLTTRSAAESASSDHAEVLESRHPVGRFYKKTTADDTLLTAPGGFVEATLGKVYTELPPLLSKSGEISSLMRLGIETVQSSFGKVF